MEVVKDNIEQEEQIGSIDDRLEQLSKDKMLTDEESGNVKDAMPAEKPIVYEPYKSDIERSMAIDEVNMLCNMINSHYYFLHTDEGNNGKQQPRLTKSTAVSVFSGEQIDGFSRRIAFINNRLIQENK